MDLNRRIILVLTVSAITALIVIPCFAQEDEENIWDEGQPREARRPVRGPNDRGRGPADRRGGPAEGRGGRPGRGSRRFELTKEEIDKTLKDLKQKDPAKAKELAVLREKDPDKFRAEIGRIVFERRMEFFRNRWREEFLEWFEKVKPREAKALAALKDKNAEVYTDKFNLARRKYWRIFEEGRRFPELEEVLLADLQLDERQDVLLRKIRAAKSEQEKKQPMAQLKEVVAAKYDLIIRRKQIAYERLLKRLEELQQEITNSREEISTWKDEKVKKQNVDKRLEDILKKPPRFRWD